MILQQQWHESYHQHSHQAQLPLPLGYLGVNIALVINFLGTIITYQACWVSAIKNIFFLPDIMFKLI